MADRPRFTVVVPCFDEAEGIADMIEGLGEALADAGHHELIVVDDGSTDGSSEILREHVRSGSPAGLRLIENASNLGYGASLKTGIRRASAELIVITDADSTYPSDRIPDLVDKAADVDMVVGAREGEGIKKDRMRRLPRLLLTAYVSWLVGQRIPDINSGLRVFRRSAVARFLNVLPDGFSFTTTLTVAMMRGRFDVRFVPIDYAPRVGKSKIRPIRDTLSFLQLILRTGMYFAPLRVLLPLVGVLGLGFLASLGYDVVVLSDLTDKTVLLLLLTLNTVLFAALADMIDKRS